MKLKNRLPHMRKQSVKVNGNRYDLDMDGIADVDNAEDAKKLLKGDAWSRYYPKLEEVEQDDASIIPEPESVPEPTPEPTPEPEPISEPEPNPVQEPVQEPVTDEETEELDKQFPDPTMDMTVKELKVLADAYQVSYKDQPNKETLIGRIMKAMYPEDEE